MSSANVQSGFSSRLIASVKSNPYPLLLTFVVAAAVLLRMYGLDWDRGFSWSPHPDERAIIMKLQSSITWPQSWAQFLSKDSPLNPEWFAYGSLPIYLLKSVGAFVSLFNHNVWGHDIYLVGRAVSGLFDVGTILLVYFIGKRLYSRKIGLLASALVAFTVLHIQLSHFFTVDSLLAFFVTLTIYFCVGIMQKADTRSIVLAGVALGLSLATKISAAPLALAIVTAFALYCATSKKDTQTLLKQVITGLPLAFLAMGITFVITEPYAFLDYGRFIKDNLEQSGMVRGTADWPFTRQYINTTSYLYHVQQSTVWGLGLFLGLAAWGGLVYSVAVAFVRRRSPEILLLSWIIPYFLIIGSFQVKYLRYLLPMTPVLCLMAAAMLFSFRGWLKGKWRLLASGAIAVIVVSSMFYAIAYDRIYAQPHPAVAVSEWINSHVPAGSKLVKEHWEEGLPNLGAYGAEPELPIYDDDSSAKAADMARKLESADYLVIFSNRLYGTIPRLPERYPMTSRYYQLLFSGQLGFELADASASYPNLFGVTLVDDTFARPGLPAPAGLDSFLPQSPITLNLGYADESFTVYDHPKVMLFKNVNHLTAAQVQQMLTTGVPTPTPESQLLLSPADAEAQQSGGAWSEIFSRDSLPNQLPVLFWLLVVEMFSLAALPLTMYLFRSFADRGYILAKTIGILVIAYLTWLAASVHVLTFSAGTTMLALLILALSSGFLALRFRAELADFVRRRWGVIALGEVVFLVAFLAFYLIRLMNPDLWHPYRGGEKPMDFAYLNAVIKSTYMPPYDPWLSGGYLNYY
ncbi:MAG: DUF2298 domain-containing protein, partial [Dehalococcoidia bacterium]|nr:DUF2298 domain-containing protein [Dehalococcoidia bacterium]